MAREVNRSVIGYMLGNFATSVIAGVVVFATLFLLGVPFPVLWALWVALVDFLPMIGGALAGIPVVLFALTHSVSAGVITLVVFLVYTQVENHVLNPIIMSRTVRVNPLVVLISILVGASIGNWIGGFFGGFVAALLSIPAAGAVQVIVKGHLAVNGASACRYWRRLSRGDRWQRPSNAGLGGGRADASVTPGRSSRRAAMAAGTAA